MLATIRRSATWRFVAPTMAGISAKIAYASLPASIALTMIEPCNPMLKSTVEPGGRCLFQSANPSITAPDQDSL